MFNIDDDIYVRRFSAARLIGLDHRTLRDRAADFNIRTARLPGQQAELYRLADVQAAIAAARKPGPTPSPAA